MKLIIIISLILGLQTQAIFGQVDWRVGEGGVSWAFACDFDNHDMGSSQVPGEQCGGKCMSTNGCTHFSWTNYLGGTCWMKTGGAQKSDAKFNSNFQMICGILPSSSPNGGGGMNPMILRKIISFKF